MSHAESELDQNASTEVRATTRRLVLRGPCSLALVVAVKMGRNLHANG